MRACRKLWPVVLLAVVAACEYPGQETGPSDNHQKQEQSVSPSPPADGPKAIEPSQVVPAVSPDPDPKEQARDFVQSCIDRVLGGDEAFKTKGPFSILTLGFAGGRIDTIQMISFVQAYSAEGEALEDQFRVKLEAEGIDYLGRSRKETVPYKVELKDGKWTIDFLLNGG